MKITPVLVPFGVFAVTVLAPVVAPVAIVNVAVTVSAFTTAMLLTVMPVLPGFIAVVPVKRVPDRVTLTVVPRAPELGLIEVSVGPITVNV